MKYQLYFLKWKTHDIQRIQRNTIKSKFCKNEDNWLHHVFVVYDIFAL